MANCMIGIMFEHMDSNILIYKYRIFYTTGKFGSYKPPSGVDMDLEHRGIKVNTVEFVVSGYTLDKTMTCNATQTPWLFQ